MFTKQEALEAKVELEQKIDKATRGIAELGKRPFTNYSSKRIFELKNQLSGDLRPKLEMIETILDLYAKIESKNQAGFKHDDYAESVVVGEEE